MIQFFTALTTGTKIDISTVDINIAFDGDSIYFGSYASEEQYIGKRVRDNLTGRANSVTFNSFGIGGQTIDNMASDAATQIDTLIDGGKTNIIVFGEEINGILNSGFTAASNLTKIKNYAAARKTAGWDYVFCTSGPYQRYPLNNAGLWEPTRILEHELYIQTIPTDFGDDIDRVIDMRLAGFIGGEIGQDINDTYFNDSSHFIDAGYDIYANEIVRQGINYYYR